VITPARERRYCAGTCASQYLLSLGSSSLFAITNAARQGWAVGAGRIKGGWAPRRSAIEDDGTSCGSEPRPPALPAGPPSTDFRMDWTGSDSPLRIGGVTVSDSAAEVDGS
jgi:hypothetical protein